MLTIVVSPMILTNVIVVTAEPYESHYRSVLSIAPLRGGRGALGPPASGPKGRWAPWAPPPGPPASGPQGRLAPRWLLPLPATRRVAEGDSTPQAAFLKNNPLI